MTGLAAHLLEELHPHRNPREALTGLSSGSGRRLWWRCQHGHEWQAPVDRRTAGSGCPFCARTIAAPETCLRTVAPEIAAEWHPTRNRDCTPEQTLPGSDQRVWWLCPSGHAWRATPQSRTSRGSGCPYCAGKRVVPERSLAVLYPNIAKQFDLTRNAPLTAAGVSAGSSRRVWWLCERGHSWQAIVKNRVKVGTSCPQCASGGRRGVLLTDARPDLVAEWHAILNGGPPDAVVAGSHRAYWWKCATDPAHIWRARVKNRVRANSGCPYCAGKRPTPQHCLAAEAPALAAEWHPERNGALSPTEVLPQSNMTVWWSCRCGQEWSARIANRAHGSGCPRCHGRP